MNRKLEICCYSPESAIAAEEAGADRIELCDNYSEGGTTPSYAAIKYTTNRLNIPVNVIIRPRGGDFLYSEVEFEIIKQDIISFENIGVNGIVIGLLLPNGDIDIGRLKEIISISKNMEITFHRAFDMCNNQLKALEELKELGIKRILTSGARNTTTEGIDLIKELVLRADNKIIIMPASGINDDNIQEIMLKTNALEFHSSAKVFIGSNMEYHNKNISMGKNDNNEFRKITVNKNMIKRMKSIIDKK